MDLFTQIGRLQIPTCKIAGENLLEGRSGLELELELELILSRWLWERGEKGGASLQKQARVRALCGVMQ